VLDKLLTSPEEPEEVDEVTEHKTTFLDALKGLETARKYTRQFDTKNNITVMCNEVEI
jgi:ABC-type transport system involved in cytochrome bd biosynthesis fused ATPase/permease subunit